jgi:DnaJ-class molecular chaperone
MAKHELDACSTCNGSGSISQAEIERDSEGNPTGKMVTRKITCPKCSGTGMR